MVKVKRSPARSESSAPDDAWQYAINRAKESGLSLPEQPEGTGEGIPSLPFDLTDYDDKVLMDLMVELTRWNEYAATRLSQAEIEERELEYRISQETAVALIKNWTGGREERVAIAKAQAMVDPQIAEWGEKHMQLHAHRKLLQSLYESLERKIATVSRELTRRTSMEPYQMRTHRWGGAK